MPTRFPITDLQKLWPFVQAVKSGSFASAAAELRVTPPAVSRSIAKLEEELGVRLFNRTTRQLNLTPQGQEFHTRVVELLAGLGHAVEALRESTDAPKGRVTISVTPTFGRYALLPKITRFTQRYPDVKVELSFDEVPPDMVAADLDVRIQHGQGDERSVVSRLLCDYPVVLVASPDYLARRGTPQVPEDLAAHDTINIHPKEASRWELVRASGRPGRFLFEPSGPLTMRGQYDTALLAALYGAGITPTAELVATDYVRAGRLCIVLPDYRLRGRKSVNGINQIYVQVQHRRHMTARVRLFLDFLYECFNDTQAPADNSTKLRSP